MPQWASSADATTQFTVSDAEKIKHSRLAFLVEYEADALGSPDPEDSSNNKERDIQTAKHELILLANLALWIANPNAIGIFAVIHFDDLDRQPNLRRYNPVRELILHLDYDNRILVELDFQLARRLHGQLLSLDGQGPAWRAAYSTYLRLREPDWASRFMQMWIAMEALFGPESGREITFQLSQRIAVFLSSEKREAPQLFRDVKSSYSWRCKAAHGLHLSKLKQDESEILSYTIEQLVATSMAKILSNADLIQTFEGPQREEFLENLILQA